MSEINEENLCTRCDLSTAELFAHLEVRGDVIGVETPGRDSKTPDMGIVEDMMAAARFYNQERFNELAQEFYQACQR